MNKEEFFKELLFVEFVFSLLEGIKMIVNNLYFWVIEEDIVEFFCVCGVFK